jgi:hypothetical protein
VAGFKSESAADFISEWMADLRRNQQYLTRGVEDLPDDASAFLTHIRGYVDRVFDLIWQAELPDRRIPSGWMDIWKRNKERGMADWETTFPQGVHRVRLLNLMTGMGVRASRHPAR